MTDDWITAREAATLSGYHSSHVVLLVRTGRVKGQKFGNAWQISRSSLMAYVQSQKQRGEKRGPKPST